MKRFGAMLILVLAAQGALADPSAARTNGVVAAVEMPAAIIAAKLAEVETHIQKITAQKIRHSVEDAIERSAVRYDGSQGATIELTMAH